MLESIMQLALFPAIYRFLTITYVTIRLKHNDLELGKMAEHSFEAGLGTLFVCLFLAFETLGCFAFNPYDDDPTTPDVVELNEECTSALYGNWMLSYSAVFTNVSYVLLYWLLDTEFQLLR